MITRDLEAAQRRAEAAGKLCTVGALIRNPQGQIFVQKRSAQRRLFPNCWDIAGGHVEAGETLTQALAREIREETGWQLASIDALLEVHEWAADGLERREFDFLVSVWGDLEKPLLEETKVTEHRWLGPGDLDILRENRQADDCAIMQLVQRALDIAPRTTPTEKTTD